MNDQNRTHTVLQRIWKEEEAIDIIGWDFTHIEGRCQSQPLPWSYKDVIKTYLSPEKRLLDLGTGGGEFLLTLNHPYDKTAVTEAYLPNLELCTERLGKLGIDLEYGDHTKPLPFKDHQFDLIIDRHESFDLEEVHRLLKTGGVFITQQVGEMNNVALSRFVLDKKEYIYEIENELHLEIEKSRDIGFTLVQATQSYLPVKYYDVGAFVYLATIIDWEFPGFSVDKCFERLLDLQNMIDNQGYFESLEHRYLLVLKK